MGPYRPHIPPRGLPRGGCTLLCSALHVEIDEEATAGQCFRAAGVMYQSE